MKVFELKAKKREKTGKRETVKLRKQEMVPCVMYGADEIVHFYAHKNEFKDLVYTDNVYHIKLDVDGKNYDAIMQDLQFHPVTDDILHIDFLNITEAKPFAVKLPVKIVGTAPGVVKGGKLRLRKRYLKVQGLLKDMPENIEIDISKLEVGDGFKVGDMSLDNITFLDRHDNQIVAVISGRAAAAAMTIEEPEAAEEGEEGEGEEGGEEAAEESSEE